jgi:hypothetical protein
MSMPTLIANGVAKDLLPDPLAYEFTKLGDLVGAVAEKELG